jgi:hypothetical protein
MGWTYLQELRPVVLCGLVTAAVLLIAWGRSDANAERDPILGSNAGDSLSFPVRPGKPFSYGQAVVFNDSDEPITLTSVTLFHPTPGMEILSAQALGPWRTFDGDHLETFSGDSGWPSATVKSIHALRPLDGHLVPPYDESTRAGRRGVELYLKMRVPDPGRYVFRRIRIGYIADGKEEHATFAHPFAACSNAALRSCPDPASVSHG